MQISLIIAYYKNLKALKLIFQALEKQTFKDFEVIIAEDDNMPETNTFVNELRLNTNLCVKHVNQAKDDGFRKTQILNRAISVSAGNFLVFIDGDCIPHRDFLLAYSQSIAPRTALFGRRVMLGKALTEQLYSQMNLDKLNFFSLLFSDSSRLKYALKLPFWGNNYRTHGIWGCNWGAAKSDIAAINGFDEDYVSAGVGEDTDIEWRLLAAGLRLKSIRFAALQYHLHHPLNYSSKEVAIGLTQLKTKQEAANICCKNGLLKLT
jgi:glycosyltransferase involved in cell wall biosynthesis